MVTSYPQMLAWLFHILQIAIPVAAFVMVVPIFGNGLVSSRIKTALVFAIALALAPTLPMRDSAYDFNLALLLETAWKMLAGIGLGLATQVFFQIFVIAGQFLGMQMGLGFAAMVDPGNGIQVTVWSQFFLMLVTLTYLAFNGHLATIEILLYGLQHSAYPLALSLRYWTIYAGVQVS